MSKKREPMGNKTLSFVMIAYNEEKNIRRALLSVKSVADEIIVLDSGSNDKTIEIAREFGAVTYYNKFVDFASQKNTAISYASKDYVFVIDADEELNEKLIAWLNKFKNSENEKDEFCASGFYVARKSSFVGKWISHSGWFPDYTLRLFKNGSGVFKKARVHESLDVKGAVLKINGSAFMNHYTYESLEQYFDKFNVYTSLAASDLVDRGYRPSIAKIVFNPIFSFIKQYIIKLGFCDGIHGFILAVLSAFYVFVKYCKHYFLYKSSAKTGK